MYPEKEGPRQRRVEQVLVDGVAESPDYDGCDEQRHGEVEIFIQQSVSTEDMALWAHE
jgi:hypothetical protein